MPSLISQEGLEEVTSNLSLRKGTLKARLLETLRAYFPNDEAIEKVDSIPVEELVAAIWDAKTPEQVRKKRKNLSGLKSALNKSLKQLIKKGKNPEGIIISRDNVFTISEERKDDLIKQMGNVLPESTQNLRQMIEALKKSFMEMPKEQDEDMKALVKEFDGLKNIVEKLVNPAFGPGAPATEQDQQGGGRRRLYPRRNHGA